MNISILAAGAGGMYCGSCMRDNALAAALKRLGHQVTLIPLYTPLRTDAPGSGAAEVYYGGVNVYLQHATRLFRRTPRVIDSIFDRPWLLNVAGRLGAQTPPEKLASLTMDIIDGEDGGAVKELDRLVEFLRDSVRPEIVTLPNLMFIGMARTFRRELGIPVLCELTGEDIFLDAMKPADRERMRSVIRGHVPHVSRFVAASGYYADRMAEYLGIPRDRIDVVWTGISSDFLVDPSPPHDRPPTIGYLARICAEKGLSRLVDGFLALRRLPNRNEVRLKIGGYLGSRDARWFRALRKRIADAGFESDVEYLGELDRPAKLALLDSIDVFCVPTAYPEAKGIYVLEALARGVPVVQPAHGSFPELLRLTGGGLLVPPGDADALAGALNELLNDPARRAELGNRGRQAVKSDFTEERMAANMIRSCEAAMKHDAPTVETSAGPAVLRVEDLWKEYPTPAEPLVVLRGVSFSVAAGETLAIVGPSGSGKSTLLNILGTIDSPTRGTVRLDETDPFSLGRSALADFRGRQVGFVFQDHHLLPQCTALENVLVARLAIGRVGRVEADRAAELLSAVGLTDRAGHLPGELSGGERQRVAIARALMNGPRLLLCDEPTGNLDQKTSHTVTQLLLDLAARLHAVLITVTHSPAVAAMFSRQMRMTDGVLAGSTATAAAEAAATTL